MSVAERTRAAVRARPALHDALLAGVVNHAALADRLDVDGDPGAVAAALRRYADDADVPEVPTAPAPPEGTTRVRMRSGVELVERAGRAERGEEGGGATTGDVPGLGGGGPGVREGGSLTAVHATGDVDVRGLEAVLGRLRVDGVRVEAAGFGADSLLVVVARRDGPDALRLVEDALKSS